MIRYLILLIFLLIILFSSLLFDYWNFVFELAVNNQSELLIFVENKFILSLIFFTLLYSLSTALSLPIGTFLTLLGGYIFGVYIGFLLVVIGATLGAVILFLIIKVGFIKSLKSIKRKSEILNKIKLGIEKDIWSYLFFIRFFPVFPFWFVNIAPAILGVRFFPYLVTTFFGIMPGTLSIIMIGSGVEDIVNQKDDFNLNIFEQKKFLIGLLVLSLISILPIFLKKFNLLKL
tara:strand:+ start:418 stop:1113 length:696 start_codon:yes stop_codon:yes gene_type:complete